MAHTDENRVYVGPLSDRIQQEIVTLLKHHSIQFELFDYEEVRDKKDSLKWVAKYKEDTVPGHLSCISFDEGDLERARTTLNRLFGFDKEEDDIPEELREIDESESENLKNEKPQNNTIKYIIMAIFIMIGLSFVLSSYRG